MAEVPVSEARIFDQNIDGVVLVEVEFVFEGSDLGRVFGKDVRDEILFHDTVEGLRVAQKWIEGDILMGAITQNIGEEPDQLVLSARFFHLSVETKAAVILFE